MEQRIHEEVTEPECYRYTYSDEPANDRNICDDPPHFVLKHKTFCYWYLQIYGSLRAYPARTLDTPNARRTLRAYTYIHVDDYARV